MEYQSTSFFECLESCKANPKCGGISHSATDISCLLLQSCKNIVEFSGFQSVKKDCTSSGKFLFWCENWEMGIGCR